MAKRSRSKVSRQERKQGRLKTARASEHGLPPPAPPPPPPARASARSYAPTPPRRRGSDSQAPRAEPLTIPPARARTLSQRIGEVSLPVKLAIVAAVASAVIWVFVYSSGPDVSRRPEPITSSAPVPAPLAPVAAPVVDAALLVDAAPPPARPSAPVAPAPPTTPAETSPRTPPALPPSPPRPPAPPPTPPKPPAEPAGAREPARAPSSLSGSAQPAELPELSPPDPAPPVPSGFPAPDPLRGTPRKPATDNPY